MRSLLSRRVLLSAFALSAFPVLGWSTAEPLLPHHVIGVYATLSLILFVMYGLDKRAARRGHQRTPEVTLQIMALCCGWPGALLAQQVFRHKTAKQSFQAVFWVMAVLNSVAFWLFFSPSGIELVLRGLANVAGRVG